MTDDAINAPMPGTTGRAGQDVETDETNRLIASDKVEGTAVYSTNGDHIGSVHNFMVDKVEGKVSYAVMSFGGFLGIGERYQPLPWEALTYRPDVGGYVVSIDPAQLENAPHHGRDEDPWADPKYGSRIYDHYGMMMRM